ASGGKGAPPGRGGPGGAMGSEPAPERKVGRPRVRGGAGGVCPAWAPGPGRPPDIAPSALTVPSPRVIARIRPITRPSAEAEYWRSRISTVQPPLPIGIPASVAV